MINMLDKIINIHLNLTQMNLVDNMIFNIILHFEISNSRYIQNIKVLEIPFANYFFICIKFFLPNSFYKIGCIDKFGIKFDDI